MKKVVVIGPEATGKSTLCAGLAAHYGTLWVPEYAREYLLQNGTAYTYEDLLVIAQRQQALEEQYAARLSNPQPSAETIPKRQSTQDATISNTPFAEPHVTATHNKLLIVDTNQYVMKVWCEVVFGNCHPWILKQAAQARCDLYLLCNVDLPWVQDGLREYPDLEMRQRLFLEYKDILVNDGSPWAVVSGSGAQRLQNAINIINHHLA